MPPRAHFLQHVPFEGLGSIGPWLEAGGWTVSGTRFHEPSTRSDPALPDPGFPDPGEIDLLVVLGGPMSVNDEAELPWLAAEKRFVRAVIEAGVPVLGICLGAQLIARAMGARVYPATQKEIGWFPVRRATRDLAPPAATFRFPDIIDVFHWHGETFDLPRGAVRLASSEACENQAFQLGACTIALQCHLETTPESAREIVENCRGELQPGASVQDEATILSAGPDRYERINELMTEVLDFLTRDRHARLTRERQRRLTLARQARDLPAKEHVA